MSEGLQRAAAPEPTFLGWQGDPRGATDPKIAAREFKAALERFAARFGVPATIVWVPLGSLITSYPGVTVEPRRTVHAGHVWPGAVLPLIAAGSGSLAADPGPDPAPLAAPDPDDAYSLAEARR